MFLLSKKGHVRANCPMWKKVIEEEEKNSKPKVGMLLCSNGTSRLLMCV